MPILLCHPHYHHLHFPQGLALDEFDKLQEGELSRLNRERAAKEEEQLLERFKFSLGYNLGLVSGV